ncbi:unnamed protein product [Phytophthora fragariaefolia]|uniref:Unnamed protein product n=1 Tax=Phytophthora fragariaefolia TaxID=1490495 RepID=A0A9W6XKF3_9STRA|nr:unnamed protein product [Phytophthora fragariaefolia]
MSYKRTLTRHATEPYQKLMSDFGPVGKQTYDGHEHFQLIQDEATRYVRGFLVKTKGDAKTVGIDHLEWLLAQGHRIEVFSTDQGPELVNTRLKVFLRGRGIEFLWTNTYSSEENGLVEKNEWCCDGTRSQFIDDSSHAG